MSSVEWAIYEEECMERRRWFDRIARHCTDNQVVLVDFKTLPHELADDATTPEYLKDILRQMVGWGGAIPISNFYAEVAKEDRARDFFRWMAAPTICMGLLNATDDRYIIREAVKKLANDILLEQQKKFPEQMFPNQVLTKFEDLVNESAELTRDLPSLKLALIQLKIQKQCHISVHDKYEIIAFARDYKPARCPTQPEIEIFMLLEEEKTLMDQLRQMEGQLIRCNNDLDEFKETNRETEDKKLVEKEKEELEMKIAKNLVERDQVDCIIDERRKRQTDERTTRMYDIAFAPQSTTTLEENLVSFRYHAQSEESHALADASTVAEEAERNERRLEELQLMMAQDPGFYYDPDENAEPSGTERNNTSDIDVAENEEPEKKRETGENEEPEEKRKKEEKRAN